MPLNFDFRNLMGGMPQQNEMWQRYQSPQLNSIPQPQMGGIAGPMMGGMNQQMGGINPSMGALQGMMNPQMQQGGGLNFGNLMGRNQNTGIGGGQISFGQPNQMGTGINPRKMIGG